MCVNMFVFDHAFAANVPLAVHWEKKRDGLKWFVCACMYVCVPVWPAIKTIALLRAFLGRLTETLMTSDWINHACRRNTQTQIHIHTHSWSMLSNATLFFTDPDFMLSLQLDATVITMLMLVFNWLMLKVLCFIVKGQGLGLRLMYVKAYTGCEAGL